jgi:MoxR-like ATPase
MCAYWQTLPLREAATSSFFFMASYIFNNVQEIRNGKLFDEIVATHIAIAQLLQVWHFVCG